MNDLLSEIDMVLTDEEFQIWKMQFIGFTVGEICKRFKLSRSELNNKWDSIKATLMLRVLKVQ